MTTETETQQETTTAQLTSMLTPWATRTPRQKLKRKVGYEDKDEQATREKLRCMQIDSDTEISTTLQHLE